MSDKVKSVSLYQTKNAKFFHIQTTVKGLDEKSVEFFHNLKVGDRLSIKQSFPDSSSDYYITLDKPQKQTQNTVVTTTTNNVPQVEVPVVNF